MIPFSLETAYNSILSSGLAIAAFSENAVHEAYWHAGHHLAFNLLIEKEEMLPNFYYFTARKVLSFICTGALLMLVDKKEQDSTWTMIKYSVIPTLASIIPAKFFIEQITGNSLSWRYIITLEARQGLTRKWM